MTKKSSSQHRQEPVADIENLYRVFNVAEPKGSTLAKIDMEIGENLAEFLRNRIVATHVEMETIEQGFIEFQIPDQPCFVSDYAEFMMNQLIAQSVHTASPKFVGHMTSALPNFMLPVSRIMTALNQNLVKTETSKAFTPLERQVLGMLHELIYQQTASYYQKWMHDPDTAIGVHCSGGTLANITALWVARNKQFRASGAFTGIANQGFTSALQHYGYSGAAILVSKRAHYSIAKAADVLGIGRDNVIAINTNADHQIDIEALQKQCESLVQNKIRILAVIGIAGTTETGNIDPLLQMAEISKKFDSHFHIDAAWGGPTLFSARHKTLLNGIEQADSVTIDAHKQLYVPMGSGMVLFKDATAVKSIEHHAQYILRQGSKDIGSHTLEGSRSGSALLLHSAFHILGRKGFELLIDQGIEKAAIFANRIQQQSDFELCSAPVLNILTYRYVPETIQKKLATAEPSIRTRLNFYLDQITERIQKLQREAGISFVSRTRFELAKYSNEEVTVFRVVLANPLTQSSDLESILVEQRELVKSDEKCREIIRNLTL